MLIGHLQSIGEDLALAPVLRGVDIMAAGGSELLANPGDPLLPGDEAAVFGSYLLLATDTEGNSIPFEEGLAGVINTSQYPAGVRIALPLSTRRQRRQLASRRSLGSTSMMVQRPIVTSIS